MAENTTLAEPIDAGPGLAVLLPDILIAGLLALSAAFFFSPVLLALAIYATLILARDTVCIVIRGHGRGRRADRYEFGTGKLEQAANLALAAIKMAIGLWLTYLVADGRMLRPLPSQSELALFALVSALFTIRCACIASIGGGPAGTRFTPIGSSPRVRLTIAISLQVALTVSAILRDPVAVGAALSAGMLLLAFALFLSGIRQSRNAVFDLVDHPPDPATGAAIQAVLASLEGEWRIVDIRARRAGEELFVELTVASEPGASIDEARRRIASLRDRFRAALPGSDVVVRLSPAPFGPSVDRR